MVDKNRKCRQCGKLCWGFRCKECFTKNKRGQVSRWNKRKKRSGMYG